MKKKLIAILLLLFNVTQQLSSQKVNIEYDKVEHFVVGATLSYSTYLYLINKGVDKNDAVIYSLVPPILFGLTKEFIDSRTKSGFDRMDLLSTFSGGLTITFVVPFNNIKKHKPTQPWNYLAL